MTALIATARGLLAAVRRYAPGVEDGELLFGVDLPADLESAVEVLQTGIRACLTGRPWWGSSAAPTRARVEPLSPDERLPGWVGMLAVEGDTTWDRIGPVARLDLPGLFTCGHGQVAGPVPQRTTRLDTPGIFVESD
jgi:hypothetical protein